MFNTVCVPLEIFGTNDYYHRLFACHGSFLSAPRALASAKYEQCSEAVATIGELYFLLSFSTPRADERTSVTLFRYSINLQSSLLVQMFFDIFTILLIHTFTSSSYLVGPISSGCGTRFSAWFLGFIWCIMASCIFI